MGLVLGILAVASLPALGQGSWIKISGGQSFSDVVDFKINPSGDRVVFTQDADVDDVLELWSVSTSGGTPVRLGAVLPGGSSIHEYFITPDGLRVVYLAPQDTFDVVELYSVPIAGGAAVKLNDQLVQDGDVVDIQISPDGGHVAYRADQQTDGIFELYRVPIAGGMVVKLSAPLPAEGDVQPGFRISPDSSRVVYLANLTPPDVDELYSVPIAGGSVATLNGALPANGDVVVFEISPDSSHVVYFADQETDQEFNLYSVPIAGGPNVKLNATDNVFGFFFRISPDGSRVVYRASDPGGVNELYRVSITGGPVIKLSGSLAAGGDGVEDWELSPDGSRVAFRAAKSSPDIIELFSVGITGVLPSLAIKLNGVLGFQVDVRDFQISADSNWVVYSATGLLASFGFRVPLAGGSAEAIWDNTQIASNQSYKIGPDSRHVVARGVGADPLDSTERLWQASLTGTPNPTARELIPVADFSVDGNVGAFEIGPAGRIVYIADQDTDEVLELYAIPELGELLFADGFE